jgi:DNA-binding transcriptional LysR family regulator
MFELSQLRCFLAAAEELHFGRAAKRLNMTQPPLSRQLQLLERVLGVRLLERTSRTVKLTPAGHSFLVEARQILLLSERAVSLAKRVGSGTAGSLKIGFTAGSAFCFLPELVKACRERLPHVELFLKEMVTAEQMRCLNSGEIDIAIIRPPLPNSAFDSMVVARETLHAALPIGHPLASRAAVALTDLDGQPFVMYAPYEGYYFHDLVSKTFSHAGVLPRYVHHVVQIQSSLALVHAGVGVSLVPTAAINVRVRDVIFRPLTTQPARAAELLMVCRKDHPSVLASLVFDIARPLPEGDLCKHTGALTNWNAAAEALER